MKEKQPHKQESTRTAGKESIVDSVIFVKPGYPLYPYALAHELTHHPLRGPDGKLHLIRGIVKRARE